MADFHAHPPYLCPTGRTTVGTSDQDEDTADSADIPSFLFDYIGDDSDNDGVYYIYANQPLLSPTKIYSYGSDRLTTYPTNYPF